MSGGALTAVIIGVVVVALVAVIAFLAIPAMRRRRLRERFGPEYDRLVSETGNQRDAEHELAEREKRHHALELKDLSDEEKQHYAREWREVQEHFVDAPAQATSEADDLITRVMSDRGYPTESFEQRAADLSVEHARTINRYRTAHSVTKLLERDAASTEDLRQAMVHYRAVFAELVDRETSQLSDTRRLNGAGEPDGRLDEVAKHDGHLGEPCRNDGEFDDTAQTDGRFEEAPDRVGEHDTQEQAPTLDADADQRVPRRS